MLRFVPLQIHELNGSRPTRRGRTPCGEHPPGEVDHLGAEQQSRRLEYPARWFFTENQLLADEVGEGLGARPDPHEAGMNRTEAHDHVGCTIRAHSVGRGFAAAQDGEAVTLVQVRCRGGGGPALDQ